MHRITAIICTLVFIPGIALAQPVISNVVSPLTDNSAVSVTGTGFGAQGPSIRIYDNFEGGTVGNDVDLTAVMGSWLGYGTGRPTYDNIGFSGSLSMRVHDGLGRSRFKIIKAMFPEAQEVFVSYWFQIPSGFTFPGTDLPGKIPTRATVPDPLSQSTWKLVWMFDGDSESTDNDVGLPFFDDGDIYVQGNNTFRIGNAIRLTFPGVSNFAQADSIFRFGEWVRITAWLKAGPSPFTGPGTTRWTYEIPTSGINRVETSTDPVFSDPHTTGAKPPFRWTHINFTGFTGNGVVDSGWSLTRPLFDEVYIATGVGAQARIEICEAPAYADCDKFGYITVSPTTVATDWTDTAISGTIRKGALTEREVRNAYVYVFDENGQVNANGFPICPNCPRPPTGLQAQ